MSEPKPTWTIGTNEFDAEFVAKWIGNTDHNYDTYITALNLRIDALCAEVGRLRNLIRDVYKAIEYRDNVVEAVNMLEEEILN